MTAKQIAEWEAYDTLEPIDSTVRTEYMLSQLISIVVNMMVSTKEGDEPITAFNFMPDWFKHAKERLFSSETKLKQNKQIESERVATASKVLNFFTSINEEESKDVK